jgi:hypothetical protein
MWYTWQTMTLRERLGALAIVVAIVGGVGAWMALGKPPFGPWFNAGFDDAWDCPPSAKASAAVCHRKQPPSN